MILNNGRSYKPVTNGWKSIFNNCSYFFENHDLKVSIRGCYKRETIFACTIEEKNFKTDLYLSLPNGFICNHFYKACLKHSTETTSNSHLTYHGKSKKKKISGEIHLVVDGNQILKDQANKLEAPLAISDDLTKFPLPICRLELSDSIPTLSLKKPIDYYFELSSQLCFFNSLDFYLARKGFMKSLFDKTTKIPGVVASIFAFDTLEVFKHGKFTTRRGRYPQVIVAQTNNYELIIIAMQEAQNLVYNKNQLHYFHNINYIKNLFSRFSLSCETGYFVDLKESKSHNKEGFIKIIDIL